jgi:DNA repair protein RecN (Recombination protein N)
MLSELAVRDLGVFSRLSVTFEPGMTALTGETGAGKTLIVEALELLAGGRADPVLVRPGASEAVVDGRFDLDGSELLLSRAVRAAGRTRAWIDGRMAPVSALADAGERLVDLHGQHGRDSLSGEPAQRALLDSFGRVDCSALEEATSRLRAIDAELSRLGGDTRHRAREIDLVRFQLDELEAAGCRDPGEDDSLAKEEERLAQAASHREAARSALASLSGEHSGAVSQLDEAVSAVAGHLPLASFEERLRSAQSELSELGAELRASLELMEDDPVRLSEVQARQALLRALRRKYGETMAEVISYEAELRRRLEALESHEARAAELESARSAAAAALVEAEKAVGRQRRSAAPLLAEAVQTNLAALAMPRARVEIRVGRRAGDEVCFLLGANPGEPMLEMSKVASGGELARAMLAARLVSASGPPTLVFDEVDAGIGGEAAISVGRALAEVAAHRQVLVVTHLPQVAAFAHHQIRVRKSVRSGRTVATAESLAPRERVVELSRMLSGRPASATARVHAEELLEAADRERGGPRGGNTRTRVAPARGAGAAAPGPEDHRSAGPRLR